jgi:hypothetical protein
MKSSTPQVLALSALIAVSTNAVAAAPPAGPTVVLKPSGTAEVQNAAGSDKPAEIAKPAEPAKPAPAEQVLEGSAGTVIVGDKESPIGLYITPWKDEFAERGLDRPARLLDEALLPIDPATFRRQIEYYDTITTYRRSQRAAAAAKQQTP